MAASAALAAMLISGCGSTRGKSGPAGPAAQTGSPSVKVDDAGDLADVARGIKTDEDQLILDLMLGYRMLLLSSPDAKTLDKETLKKSRNAYDRLEKILRHGGVKAQEGGERVYTITNETKLSLQEVIRSAAEAAEKAAQEGDWDRARDRWKEITQSRQAVTFTMEEAQWGLVLADALQSALPDSTKRRLKSVNESYMADIGHEEIGKQVKTLLETVPDVKLQRELKKLANRSWEKDKKAGRISAQTQQAQAAAALAGTVPPGSAPGDAQAVPENPGTGAASAGQGAAGQVRDYNPDRKRPPSRWKRIPWLPKESTSPRSRPWRRPVRNSPGSRTRSPPWESVSARISAALPPTPSRTSRRPRPIRSSASISSGRPRIWTAACSISRTWP